MNFARFLILGLEDLTLISGDGVRLPSANNLILHVLELLGGFFEAALRQLHIHLPLWHDHIAFFRVGIEDHASHCISRCGVGAFPSSLRSNIVTLDIPIGFTRSTFGTSAK